MLDGLHVHIQPNPLAAALGRRYTSSRAAYVLDSLGDRVTRLARPSAATHVVRVVCVVFGVPLPYTFTFSSWSTLLHMVLCD